MAWNGSGGVVVRVVGNAKMENEDIAYKQEVTSIFLEMLLIFWKIGYNVECN